MAVLNGSVGEPRKVRLPPKRGQLKVEIIRKFVKMVSGVVSKAVALGRKQRKARKVIAENGPAFKTAGRSNV